jgi:hypothetical protein
VKQKFWITPLQATRFFDVEIDAVDFASRDLNILVGDVQRSTARKSPYADTIEGGTLENASETVRTAVQRQVMPAADMVFPAFTSIPDACGKVGGEDQVGFTEYFITPGNYRGRGPKICVKGTRTGFAQEYPVAVEGLKRNIVLLTNADIRANYILNSGCKAVAKDPGNFIACFAGDEYLVQQPFPASIPDAPLSFSGLSFIGRHMREALNVEPFDNPQSDHGMMKWVGSADSIELFRDELNIRADVAALTTGGYRVGQETIQGYTWEGPYHGIAFGIDPDPVRASGFTIVSVVFNGVTQNTIQPTYVQPWIRQQVSSGGFCAVRNPKWINADFELGFLFARRPFKRLVPASYRVEGFPFAPQIANGGLEFRQLIDRGTMTLGDYGQHFYEIERAYQPVMPHAVCPIFYARCAPSLDFTKCTTLFEYGS